MSLAVSEHPTNDATEVELADLIVSYLEQIGIEYVFGIPGGAVEPLYNALARSQRRGGPRPVVARHEAGAAFMADGYARETGNIGVCLATSGPGATNMITGVACAYDNGIPLLAITGQPQLSSFGMRALQESACTGINVLGMFEHCTHYNSLVSHPNQLESKLVNALSRACHSPKGPVHLSIPVDIQRSAVGIMTPSYDLRQRLRNQVDVVDQIALQKLLDELKSARHPVFLLGSGCGEAIDSVLELIDLTDSVYVTTPDAKGLVDTKDPNYHGVFGFAGHTSAQAALSDKADLIIAMGTALGEMSSWGWSQSLLNNRLIHIDDCHENLSRSPMAKLHLYGSISSVCRYLAKQLRKSFKPIHSAPGRAEPVQHLDQTQRDRATSNAVPIKPQRLMRELSNRCPPNTCFVADNGNSMSWAIHHLTAGDNTPQSKAADGSRTAAIQNRHNWLRVTMDFAPMGWAIGAAVGMARANSSIGVVCLTGDGSYLMSGQEITVAAEEKLPVLFVVLNDSALGMVKHGQRLAGAQRIAFELPQIDYRLLAESLGIPGYVVRSPEDFNTLNIEDLLQSGSPALLDIRIDSEEVPPMALRIKTLGNARQ